jgi:YjbE family integral membrane protein
MDLAGLTHELSAFAQVLIIDVALAGDNAVVVGMAVAGLPARQQRPAIILGIGGATLIRIGFGAIALQLLEVLGLLLAGGLLLLWVCWKMYREVRRRPPAGTPGGTPRRKTLAQAMAQIVLADVSMSLDNVLAVAGAAGGSPWVLAAGLTISVVLMGIAAGLLARILERQRWIAWVGLLIVLSVALRMIWQGSRAVAGAM